MHKETTEKESKVQIWQIAKAVMHAFIGIRRKNDLEHDAETLKPMHVIIGGLIGGLIFVLSVLVIVNLVLQ